MTSVRHAAAALGIVFDRPLAYPQATALQEALVAARLDDRIPDVVLFLEHPPVITLGMRAKAAHLLADPATLAARGVAVERTSRGGDVTYHAPGQLVVYPVLKLTGAEADTHRYVAQLEEAALRTAADFGVAAFRRKGKTGVWTDRGKLAAIGVRVRRWVAFHGLSFNVDPDLAGFALIVPCGLHGEAVTSLREIMGRAGPSLKQVRERMAAHVAAATGRDLEMHTAGDAALAESVRDMLAAAGLQAQAAEQAV